MMDPKILKFLKDFSRSMGNFVWILDENWQILWGTIAYDDKKNIPEFLQVSQDSWEDTEKEVYWNTCLFTAKLVCYPKYKARTLAMQPSASTEKIFPTFCQTILDTVQNLKSITDRLEYENHKKNLWNLDHLFQKMRSDLQIQNKIPYMCQLLDLANREKEKEIFWIRSELKKIFKNINEILDFPIEFQIDQQYVDLSAEEMPDKISQNMQSEFIYENRKFFCATILNAFLLCCHDPNLKQHAQINLNQNRQNKEIEILITIAAEKQKSNSIFADTLLESPDKTKEFIMEKNFLEVFCSLHEGTWELLQNKNEKVSQNICKIVIKTAESAFLEFHQSRKGNHEREFYNICEMIFAEFRSSKIIF